MQLLFPVAMSPLPAETQKEPQKPYGEKLASLLSLLFVSDRGEMAQGRALWLSLDVAHPGDPFGLLTVNCLRNCPARKPKRRKSRLGQTRTRKLQTAAWKARAVKGSFPQVDS